MTPSPIWRASESTPSSSNGGRPGSPRLLDPYDRFVTGREIRIDPGSWDAWVSTPRGPQLIVAGPGTGKTEFLIERVAHIVGSGLARRDQVCFLTFSRRAAADIRRRVSLAIGGSGAPIDASTFHSLAMRLIEAGTGSRPVSLTAPEQVTVVAGLLAGEDPEAWPVTYRGILGTRVFAAEIADFLTRCSERLLSPDDLSERAARRADWRGIPGLFTRYREALDDLGRTDYGTLLVSAVDLLETTRGQELAGGYRFVVIDEYQDTSPAQAEMARRLSAPHGNLTVAGDPYQSIYSFRGAEVRNVADFSEEHPDAVRIVLDKSLRVPPEILDAALRVVSSGELPGSAGRVRPAEHRGRVEAYVFDQETAEADWIARQVEQSIAGGTEPSQIAVLVRSKRELLRELSRALDRRDVPHDQPDTRLVDHPAVRGFHDLSMVAIEGSRLGHATPGEMADSDRAMRRILLGPMHSVGLGKERQVAQGPAEGRSDLGRGDQIRSLQRVEPGGPAQRPLVGQCGPGGRRAMGSLEPARRVRQACGRPRPRRLAHGNQFFRPGAGAPGGARRQGHAGAILRDGR